MVPPNLLSLASLTLLLPSVLATCTNFTVRPYANHDTSYTMTGGTRRVSGAINCSDPSTFNPSTLEGPSGFTTPSRCNNTQCELYTPDNYHVRVDRTLNTSTSNIHVADGIFNLINKLGYFQLPDRTNLNTSWVYPISGASTCLNEGMAGYWAFTPTLRCVDGTLSGCSADNGDPADGTSLRACAVAVLTNGIVDGTIGIVQTSGEDSNMPYPTNATLTPGDQQRSDDQNSANEARAVRWSGTAVVVSLVAVGLGLML